MVQLTVKFIVNVLNSRRTIRHFLTGLSLILGQHAIAAETKESISMTTTAQAQPAQSETEKFCEKLKEEGSLPHEDGPGCIGKSLLCVKQALFKSQAVESLPTVGADIVISSGKIRQRQPSHFRIFSKNIQSV